MAITSAFSLLMQRLGDISDLYVSGEENSRTAKFMANTTGVQHTLNWSGADPIEDEFPEIIWSLRQQFELDVAPEPPP